MSRVDRISRRKVAMKTYKSDKKKNRVSTFREFWEYVKDALKGID